MRATSSSAGFLTNLARCNEGKSGTSGRRSNMLTRRLFVCLTVCSFGLGLEVAKAQTTLTINLAGTAGPILSGTDPLGGNGKSAAATVVVSESLTPTTTTSTSATYTLPAGAITVSVGSLHYTTTSPAKMTISIPSAGRDSLTFAAAAPLNSQVMVKVSLAKGSFPLSALVHPTAFSPSPQTFPSATTATGPGSKVKYIFGGQTTVLGLTGTASDVSAADAQLEEDEPEQ
jgi:hypothetical protein